MADESTAQPRRLNSEIWPIAAVDAALFGQAALPDRRVNDRVDRLQKGKAVIRERLTATAPVQARSADAANCGELSVVLEEAAGIAKGVFLTTTNFTHNAKDYVGRSPKRVDQNYFDQEARLCMWDNPYRPNQAFDEDGACFPYDTSI